MENKISWRTLEYKKKEKTNDWYWAVIIIALSITVISFMLGDGLFGILIIIGTGTLLMFSTKDPHWVEISINQRGLAVGRDLYPFATLEDFWIDIADDENYKILLKSKKLLMPLIVLPLEEYHHLDVREFLLQYLPEKEMHEPVSHKIMEKLGF